MNYEDFRDCLATSILEANTSKIKTGQLMKLDKQIQENEAQLNNSLIRIPFTGKKILDDLGIIKKYVPALLETNKQLITEYNEKLKEVQSISQQANNHLSKAIDDYSHSTGKDKQAKADLIINDFNWSIQDE